MSLHAAANSGDLARVKALVNQGVNIDAQTSDRWTALHRAVQQQTESIVRFLIDNGANCNVANKDGQTPLHLAAAHDNVLILLLLVEGHAEINPQDVFLFFRRSPLCLLNGVIPLHLAAEKGLSNSVKFLCSCGANTNAIDHRVFFMIMESFCLFLGCHALCGSKWTRGGYQRPTAI
jgi:ankyrin repeat protein